MLRAAKSLALVLLLMLAAAVCAGYAEAANVVYRAHCADIGWQNFVQNGATAGTTGQGRRMEALEMRVSEGGIEYRAHVANIGWQNWVGNGATAGTTGRGLQMEAVQIRLTNGLQNNYSVEYRAHCANIGWTGWVRDGAVAGTTGRGLRMEALEVRLVGKNPVPVPVPPGDDYDTKVRNFLNTPKYASGGKTTWDCFAYATQFVKYVFGKNSPRDGQRFTNPNEIRAGDVIHNVPQPGVNKSNHWLVVLYRNGDKLTTVEGNWTNHKTEYHTDVYTVSGRVTRGQRTFSEGFHFR